MPQPSTMFNTPGNMDGKSNEGYVKNNTRYSQMNADYSTGRRTSIKRLVGPKGVKENRNHRSRRSH